jgi:predicted DNA-binding transcriptional regulator AlpA
MMKSQAESAVYFNALSEYNDLLSVTDLSKIFCTSVGIIYKEIQNGTFGTPIRIGRSYRFPKVYLLKRFFQIHHRTIIVKPFVL